MLNAVSKFNDLVNLAVLVCVFHQAVVIVFDLSNQAVDVFVEEILTELLHESFVIVRLSGDQFCKLHYCNRCSTLLLARHVHGEFCYQVVVVEEEELWQ